MKQHYDAIIIGGGASGLMCAIAAKRKNPRMSVAIIEKNDRVGKKLLSTGNGRCNLTNANVAPDKYVGNGAKKLVGAVLQKYNVQSLLDYFVRRQRRKKACRRSPSKVRRSRSA